MTIEKDKSVSSLAPAKTDSIDQIVGRQKVREEVQRQLKKMGKDILVDFSSNTSIKTIIPSSSIGFNLLLGVGGLPGGRIVEVFGKEGGGKTLCALDFIANAQKLGGLCAFLDAEHTFDMRWAKTLGVDIEKLDLVQALYGEQNFEIMETMINSGAYGLIVLDSVAALFPKSEMDGTLEKTENNYATLARMMSKALRRLAAIASKSNTALLFINQLRDNVGVMYGPTEITPGGRALGFFASVRFRVDKITKAECQYKNSSGAQVGHRLRIKVIKNKVAPNTGQSCELDLYYLKGIDKVKDIIDQAVVLDLISLRAEKYKMDGTDYTLESLREKITSDTKFTQQLITSILKVSKEQTEGTIVVPKVAAKDLE